MSRRVVLVIEVGLDGGALGYVAEGGPPATTRWLAQAAKFFSARAARRAARRVPAAYAATVVRVLDGEGRS
jgi:hypothetical protein